MIGFFVFFLSFTLFLLTSYLSSCETAITISSRAKFYQMAKEGDKRAKVISNLKQNLGLFISVILMCNTMINAWITSIVSEFYGVIGASAIAILLVLYAEVVPKMIAINYSEKILLSSSSTLSFIFKIFSPLNKIINFIAIQSLKLFKLEHGSSEGIQHASIEELKGLIDLHRGPGSDTIHERVMLKSILDLGSVEIGAIMRHRKDIMTLNADEPIHAIISKVLNSPYSRFPVWQGHSEEIVGTVHTKALLRMLHNSDNEDEVLVLSACSPPWFIPETTDLLQQLQEFKRKKGHMAIVVDEYGALLGVVTLEDILEEIVGDIQDEYDTRVQNALPLPDGSIIVDGDLSIRDLNRQFNFDLSDENATTISGFLMHETRSIPGVGQVIILHGFRFEILNKKENIPQSIKIRKISKKQNNLMSQE